MVTYNGKQYKTRLFMVDNPEFGEQQTIRISTDSLSEAMGGKVHDEGIEQDIDDTIYFYVGDEVIDLDPREICESHLDVPMKFIEEISEEYLEN